MKSVETISAPLPAGHYSQAVTANGMVFVSGQLPIVPGGGCVIPDGIDAQSRQVMKNLHNVLQAAGSSPDRLLSVQIFIADMGLWNTVDAIYREFVGTHKPARTVIPCGVLHYGALIEISAVALADAIRT